MKQTTLFTNKTSETLANNPRDISNPSNIDKQLLERNLQSMSNDECCLKCNRKVNSGIQCDDCETWWHFGCAGIKENEKDIYQNNEMVLYQLFYRD